jgi:hypothetical protein
MTKFKQGDKFIPRKPKPSEGVCPLLEQYWDKVFTVKSIANNWLISLENGIMFHPHWCEKVEENSANFVQRECDTIQIETPLSISATATLGDVKKPFLIVTTNHHGGIKYEEGTAKSPYIPLIPLSPNHIPEVRKTIDWEQRKWEVVMQLAAARLSRINIGDHPSHCKTEVKFTIELADEMIKQLKGE